MSDRTGRPVKQAEESKQEKTRTKVVRAGECPRNPMHNASRVYRTVKRTRYCVCDECGETWKRSGDEATTFGN